MSTDKIIEAMERVSEKFAALAEKYGPEVVDAGLSVVRLTGVNNLIANVGGILIGGAAAYICFRAVRKEQIDHDDIFDADPVITVGGGIAGACGVITFAACTLHMFDVWNWIAMFEPKLYVAKKLLGL